MKSAQVKSVNPAFVDPIPCPPQGDILITAAQLADQWGISDHAIRRDIMLAKKLCMEGFEDRVNRAPLTCNQVKGLARIRNLRTRGYQGAALKKQLIG